MNKATVLKSVTAVVGAGVAAYCGQLAAPVLVLLCMMVIDYITGMVKAYMTAQLSSRIGVKGILKKLCYMAMVAVGAGVDYLLRGALVQAVSTCTSSFSAACWSQSGSSSTSSFPSWKILRPSACRGFRGCLNCWRD